MEKVDLKGKRKMEDVYESQLTANNHQYQHEDAAMNMEMEWANNYNYNDQEFVSDQDLEYLDDCLEQILGADEDLHLLRDCYQDVPSVQLRELPPGFVFAPSDQELLSLYLKWKIENPEIQFDVMPCIPDINVYKYHPEKLLERYQEKSGYFFTERTKRCANGNRPRRTVEGYGYWRMSMKTEPVKEGNIQVGEKCGLVFHTGNPKDDKRITKTDWLMKEYHIPGCDWTLCSIYLNN